jgi:transposase
VAIDPNSLPRDAETLRKIVVDLAEQLDRSLAEQNKYQTLLRELLEAQRNRKSEQLSKEQLALFEAAWQARRADAECSAGEDDDDRGNDAGGGAEPNETPNQKRGGRQALARHLKRERIVHDLAETEKHCHGCGKDLRLIAEETSERYEYIPASMKVIQDVCLKYACDCTVKTAIKPPQPIEKSTAGASLLAQVIVAKWADHQPLHRQEKIFERHGIEISRKTMGGWMAQCAALLDPLYQLMKKELLSSRVIGTDDTSVKVLDRKLPFARIGRIWPYVGDAHHPVILYDYTPTRSRAGPAKFLEGYKGYLQADAYSVYDAFFKPQRGMTEVGCWMHARRYLFKALESDEPHMGPALHLVARLYAVEERAKTLSLSAEQRWALRQRVSARLVGRLHQYLLALQPKVLPKSPSGAAVRYALN